MSAAPATRTRRMPASEKLKGHLAMLLFSVLIAASFSFGKLVTPYIAPAPLNAARFLLGAAIVGVMAFGMRRIPFSVPAAPWRYAVMGGLMAYYFLTMFIALGITAPVSTSAVFTLMPILTGFFGYLILRQVVRPMMALSLVFAGLGSIWVIFRGDVNALLSFDVGPGEMIYFTGCIAHAIYAPLISRFHRGEPIMVMTFFTLLATALWSVLFGLGDIAQTDWFHLPAIVWLVLAFLAVFPTAATFLLIQYANLRLPASKALAYGYLVPVNVIVIEGLSGHGWVSLPVMLGALVTCLALVVLYFAREEKPPVRAESEKA